MNMSELSRVSNSELLNGEQMLKLFTYVNQREEDRDPSAVDFPAIPRNPDLPRFRFTEASEDNGIIGWIATHGRKKEWANPHAARLVVVTASSWCSSLNPGNDYYHVVEQHPSVSFGTNNEVNSWIQVDLQNWAVVPDHYRYANTRTTNCMPRSWRFEGSKDGRVWVTLREHVGDFALNGGSTVAHWPIEGIKDAFRYFRILQPGMTSEGGFGHLVCAGLEIWGRVRRLPKSS